MDLQKLNSLTKYPSIPTYHAMGPKGKLLEEVVKFSGDVIGTEKIDGVNSRIIILPTNEYIIGSREELLYYSDDVLYNPALGIVEALRSVADKLENKIKYGVTVLYLEVYGGNVTANSKNYTSNKQVAFRLFDIALIDNVEERLADPIEEIALWREQVGQPFATEEELRTFSKQWELPLTPRLFTLNSSMLPTSIAETKEFLYFQLPWTHVALDDEVSKVPEGIVLRTPDRATIAKMKFRDYR